MAEEYDIRAFHLRLGAPTAKTVEASGVKSELCLDECAFRVLYEQTSRPLLRYLLGMTRRPDLAEDLLQETYCRFLTARLPEMDEGQMRSYLFRIATNLLRDHWRRPKDEPALEASAEPPALAPHLERRFGVRQAFYRLKPRERQLLWLAYVEGSNHQEIAASTGLRAGSIRLLLFRARRRLAQLIGGKSGGSRREVGK